MKEYIIDIPRIDGLRIWNLATAVLKEWKDESKENLAKFEQTQLGLALMFSHPDYSNEVYKLNETHLMSVLDTAGGFFAASNLAATKYNDKSAEKNALKMMKTAMEIERQAITQGFKRMEKFEPLRLV